jgi:hypothetical protein
MESGRQKRKRSRDKITVMYDHTKRRVTTTRLGGRGFGLGLEDGCLLRPLLTLDICPVWYLNRFKYLVNGTCISLSYEIVLAELPDDVPGLPIDFRNLLDKVSTMFSMK